MSLPYIIRRPRDADAAWMTRECSLATGLPAVASLEAVVLSFLRPFADNAD